MRPRSVRSAPPSSPVSGSVSIAEARALFAEGTHNVRTLAHYFAHLAERLREAERQDDVPLQARILAEALPLLDVLHTAALLATAPAPSQGVPVRVHPAPTAPPAPPDRAPSAPLLLTVAESEPAS